MESLLDEGQRILRDTVRSYFERELPLSAGEPPSGDSFLRGPWDGLQRLGCFDLAPDGRPESIIANGMVVLQELGYAAFDSPYLGSAVLLPLAAHESGDGHEASLRAIWEHGRVTSFSGEPTNVATGAARGFTRPLPWGNAAEYVLLAPDTSQPPGLFAVEEAGAAEVSRMVGGEPRAAVRLAAEPLVVFEGAGERVLAARLQQLELLGVAAFMVGSTERAMNLAVAYAGERVQFGRPIGSFQAIQMKCADMHIKFRAALLLTLSAAHALCRDALATRLVLSTHIFASKAYRSVAREALQVHGGIGLVENHPVQRFYKGSIAYGRAYGDLEGRASALGNLVLADARSR